MSSSTTEPRTSDAGELVRQDRTWTIKTTCGCTVSGYLPAWAEVDPSETGVLLDELPTLIADMNHWTCFPGQRMAVAHRGVESEDTEVFRTTIDANPYVGGPLPRLPVANIRIVGDYWLHGLTPTALAEVATQLRAQAALLDDEIRPQLISAREDWLTQQWT
ncbi:hypothetical protein SAMN05216251_102381 [Actinacidiphila alni]|uniref:Uncharacterized protein n=1 Tax=Actinacidiphila alni TaxID=380248 RepID=A0A1I1ZAP1_9ACTN|nr:hypothetical protein [Actinacidiphila alni]SFE28749.1 hypothetical protein SAMN05216251_102381 [Actinacidiphila alni]